MADYAIGPNGLQFGGTPDCQNNLLGMNVTNPAAVLKERLTEQYFKGISRTKYEDVGVDEHMPMRGSTSQRTDGVDEFRVNVSLTGIANNSDGIFNPNPTTGAFNLQRTVFDRCGIATPKTLGARGNTNAEGCNPAIDGPVPIVGLESTGREPYALRAPISPLCTQDFANKHPGLFASTLDQMIQVVVDGTLYRWQLHQLKWIISKSRFLASPLQTPTGDGRAKLSASPDLFTQFQFGHIPTHHGSPDWIAAMIRFSEIPQRQNVKVELPVSILMKYKEEYFAKLGFNAFNAAATFSRDLNGYLSSVQNEELVYQDRVTGRKIRFVGTTKPVYVEVSATGPTSGEWYFQEKKILRDSETSNQVMERENPIWGTACSCTGRILAAIVTVSADDGEKPFYKEPMPNNNPDARIRDVIAKYGGGNVNATLLDLYPTSLEIRLLTGLDAQTYLIEPLNRQYRDAGWDCDKFSNLENTYVGGYVKIGGVFVENKPRELIQFLLRVPQTKIDCVEFVTPCLDDEEVPDAIDLEPGERKETFPEMDIPAPPSPPEPEEGLIRPLTNQLNLVAPCEGTKKAQLVFVREGGSSGELVLAISGTESEHAANLPANVTFADGELYKVVEFDLSAWACENGESETETFEITYGPENLAEDPAPFTTATVCITCNKGCGTGACPPMGGDCSSCG